jgi:hypothetical protein
MPLELECETSRIDGAKFRRLRGGSLLNENQGFQNEPKPADVSPLSATQIDPEISTEPKEPKPSGTPISCLAACRKIVTRMKPSQWFTE